MIDNIYKEIESIISVDENIYSKSLNKLSINTINFLNDKYELDHKFSRFMGYVLKVPIEIMSSIYNLEILKLSDNKVKGLKCSITKEELYELYKGSK